MKGGEDDGGEAEPSGLCSAHRPPGLSGFLLMDVQTHARATPDHPEGLDGQFPVHTGQE